MASHSNVRIALLAETLVGLSLVIAGACVFNNYLDRGIDKKMKRTKKRALATNLISIRSALLYASILYLAGSAVLAIFANWLVFSAATVAVFWYVVIYGLAKRRTIHSTLVGSVPGAIPPVIGYLAVTDRIDTAAIILFLILIFWQMPHFYAIAMYRYQDYKAAGLPILTVRQGTEAAKLQIIIYIALFAAAASLLTIFSYTGYTYLVVALVLSSYWLWKGLGSYRSAKDETWGRSMFLTSLLVNLGISLAIAVGALLP